MNKFYGKSILLGAFLLTTLSTLMGYFLNLFTSGMNLFASWGVPLLPWITLCPNDVIAYTRYLGAINLIVFPCTALVLGAMLGFLNVYYYRHPETWVRRLAITLAIIWLLMLWWLSCTIPIFLCGLLAVLLYTGKKLRAMCGTKLFTKHYTYLTPSIAGALILFCATLFFGYATGYIAMATHFFGSLGEPELLPDLWLPLNDHFFAYTPFILPRFNDVFVYPSLIVGALLGLLNAYFHHTHSSLAKIIIPLIGAVWLFVSWWFSFAIPVVMIGLSVALIITFLKLRKISGSK